MIQSEAVTEKYLSPRQAFFMSDNNLTSYYTLSWASLYGTFVSELLNLQCLLLLCGKKERLRTRHFMRVGSHFPTTPRRLRLPGEAGVGRGLGILFSPFLFSSGWRQ